MSPPPWQRAGRGGAGGTGLGSRGTGYPSGRGVRLGTEEKGQRQGERAEWRLGAEDISSPLPLLEQGGSLDGGCVQPCSPRRPPGLGDRGEPTRGHHWSVVRPGRAGTGKLLATGRVARAASRHAHALRLPPRATAARSYPRRPGGRGVRAARTDNRSKNRIQASPRPRIGRKWAL